MSEQTVTVCDYCFRSANGDNPDCVYCNPFGCGHDLCSDHLYLRTKDGGHKQCRVCFAAAAKKAKEAKPDAVHPAQR